MAETSIEWTATIRPDGSLAPGFTWNPWIGCCKVSPGCKNCYAETLTKGRMQLQVWGPSAPRYARAESAWKEPLSWDRAAAKLGERRRVFSASLADVFEGPDTCQDPDAYRVITEGRERLWRTIDATPNLDWLLLTKRTQHIMEFVPSEWRGGFPSNVMIGASIEDQATAEERLSELIAVPAPRFLSCEPLLDDVKLGSVIGPWTNDGETLVPATPLIQWVIGGGESGPRSRMCRIEHLVSVAMQCEAASVPVFVKQLGARPAFDYYTDDDNLREWSGLELSEPYDPKIWQPTPGRPGEYHLWSDRDGQPAPGTLVEVHLPGSKGGDPRTWPRCLRAFPREFPAPASEVIR